MEQDDAHDAQIATSRGNAANDAPGAAGTAAPAGSENARAATAIDTGTAADAAGTAADVAPLAAEDRAPTTGDQPRAALAPGMALGPYTVAHVLASEHAHGPFRALLRETHDAVSIPSLPGLHHLLQDLPASECEAAMAVATLGLQHPRLLAPRAVLAHEGWEYLVVEIVAELDGGVLESVSQGARLSPEDTLRAGAALADALAYLQRNGVAHLHISPDTLYIRDGRAYLGGIEGATVLARESDDGPALFARDANYLARSLSTVAGLPETAPPDEAEAARQLRRIAAAGTAGTYSTPDELSAGCGQALQTSGHALPVPETAPVRERLVLRSGSATTVGRVRADNQDAAAAVIFDLYDDLAGDMPGGIFLIADGMGGEAHGEIASRIAARIVVAELTQHYFAPLMLAPATVSPDEDGGSDPPPSDDLGEALTHAITAANAQVRALSEYLGQPTGSTLTAVCIRGHQAILAHLGDSRAYLLHDGMFIQLTEDHSLLARLQAMDHPLLHDPSLAMSRSILYRSLGQDDAAPADVVDLALVPGDRLLICCDGLWDELDDQTLGRALADADDPTSCAHRLVRLANEAGGHDNSTALIVFVQALEPDPEASFAREGPAEDDAVDDAENNVTEHDATELPPDDATR